VPFAVALIEPNVGAVAVPDERLWVVNQYQETEKVIPAAAPRLPVERKSRAARS
jgi:ribosome-binding ATPase YchF (GTP1/OBG family)